MAAMPFDKNRAYAEAAYANTEGLPDVTVLASGVEEGRSPTDIYCILLQDGLKAIKFDFRAERQTGFIRATPCQPNDTLAAPENEAFLPTVTCWGTVTSMAGTPHERKTYHLILRKGADIDKQFDLESYASGKLVASPYVTADYDYDQAEEEYEGTDEEYYYE